MKKLFCKDYKELECCETCHRDDSFQTHYYKGFEFSTCCQKYLFIFDDIDRVKKLEEKVDKK